MTVGGLVVDLLNITRYKPNGIQSRSTADESPADIAVLFSIFDVEMRREVAPPVGEPEYACDRYEHPYSFHPANLPLAQSPATNPRSLNGRWPAINPVCGSRGNVGGVTGVMGAAGSAGASTGGDYV
jgi:hypothetical protein